MEGATQVITFVFVTSNMLLSLLAFLRNKYDIANFYLGLAIFLALTLRLP